MPPEVALRVVSLPATDQQEEEQVELELGERLAVRVGLSSLVTMSSRGLLAPLGRQRVGVRVSSMAAYVPSSGSAAYSGSSAADHAVGPVEDLFRSSTGDAEQLGDHIERQLGGEPRTKSTSPRWP